jgi:ACS family hexuronate transporter-like MFS transporter
MGGTIGAAIAAPLVAWLTIRHGWRSAFVVTGIAGFLLALFWLLIYRAPPQCATSSSEREMLQPDVLSSNAQPVLETSRSSSPLCFLFTSKAFWGIVLARMITDPVWYFYLFWFPKYLQEGRGMSLAAIGKLLWIIFVAADLGSLAGGLASSRRIRANGSTVRTRVRIMAFAAIVPCFTFVIPSLPGYIFPLTAACCAAFAHMAWMTNATTLPIDIFPAELIGSVQGMVGAFSSMAAVISTSFISLAVTHLSYAPVFYVASFLYPLALIVLMQIPGATLKGEQISI